MLLNRTRIRLIQWKEALGFLDLVLCLYWCCVCVLVPCFFTVCVYLGAAIFPCLSFTSLFPSPLSLLSSPLLLPHLLALISWLHLWSTVLSIITSEFMFTLHRCPWFSHLSTPLSTSLSVSIHPGLSHLGISPRVCSSGPSGLSASLRNQLSEKNEAF